jgi:hypothetical protein
VVFIEWWLVRGVCAVLLIVAAASFSFWSVRRKRRPVRIPIQFFSGLVLCALLLWLCVSALPRDTYSAPVYSPNETMAVRVIEYDASGLGGADDTVELFTGHGFHSDVVFRGEFRSVDLQSIRWKSNSELEVSYEGTAHQCISTGSVVVHCIARQQEIR